MTHSDSHLPLVATFGRYLFMDAGRVGTQSAFVQLFKAVESGPYAKHTFNVSYAEDSVKEHRKASFSTCYFIVTFFVVME